MKDPIALIIVSIFTAFVSVITYWAWFSPKWYCKFINFYKRWVRKTSIIYPEELMNFFCASSGFGFWFVRILLLLVFLIGLRVVLFSIWGI